MDSGPPSEEVLLAFFGPGELDDEGLMHCYKQEGTDLYVALKADESLELNRKIASIYVGSKRPRDCDKSSAPKTPFRGLTTPEGLSVGDTEARVKELYGVSPSFKLVHDRSGLRTVATFQPCSPTCPSLWTRIVLVGGKVESIMISNRE